MIIEKERGSVFCNDDAWKHLDKALKTLNPSSIFIIVDSNTKVHCLPEFIRKSSISTYKILEIKPGEIHKNIETCAILWQELSDKGADRKSLIINLGGGVITDLGGFVAATFKRGIEFINIPTSLLAMVDASVGGKTGVDLGALKNQIGIIRDAYHVIIDTDFLKTLPKEHITSGYAEMIKHGLISSEKYWKSVQHFDSKNEVETTKLIWESVLIKNKVVTNDPLEKGIRKTLNYGHTLGHAIESYSIENTNKKDLLHGEAIAIGMVLATYISSQLVGFPQEKCNIITAFILERYTKQHFLEKEIEEIIKLLIYDKKNQNGKVLFVLLQDIGVHCIGMEVSNTLIYSAFQYYKEF